MSHPKIKILVLTIHKDKEYLHQAVTGGAEGDLLKEDAESELFSVIDRVRRGKKFVSSKFSEGLMERLSLKKTADLVEYAIQRAMSEPPE